MKLYFDECCSPRLPRVLKEAFSGLETCHVLDFYDRGTAESKWLQPLHDDRSWIVITNDRSRNPKKEKFHLVCAALGITHVVLTPTLINAGYDEQKAALLAVFDQLTTLHNLPPGTRVRLGFKESKVAGSYALRVGGKLLASVLPN
jgi:predicted nuclease of predicted toxin-antitoxin system